VTSGLQVRHVTVRLPSHTDERYPTEKVVNISRETYESVLNTEVTTDDVKDDVATLHEVVIIFPHFCTGA